MTDNQKATIAAYRKDGYGYGKISQLTGISENTIKSFCKRTGLGGIAVATRPSEDGLTCKCCGVPITQTPGKRAKKFCSDRCRQTWWSAHQDLIKRKANYEFVCPTCGMSFTVYGNAHRKYCSHSCYIKDRFRCGRHE